MSSNPPAAAEEYSIKVACEVKQGATAAWKQFKLSKPVVLATLREACKNALGLGGNDFVLRIVDNDGDGVDVDNDALLQEKLQEFPNDTRLLKFWVVAAPGPDSKQASDASLQTRYDEQSKELAQLKAAQQPKDDVSTATVSNGVTKIRVQVHSEPYVLEVKLEFESAPTPTALFNKLRSGNSKMVIPADASIYFEPRVPGSKRIAYTQDSAKFDWLQFACAADGIYIARLEVATPNTSPEKQAKTVSLNDQTLVSAINSIRKLHGPLVATPEICAFIRDYRQCGHAARWALLSTARMKMPFVGRDAQLLALLGKAIDYAAKWRARTGVWERKESTAFPTVFVSAGRGKSRLCVELEATLRTAANNGKFGDGPNDCTVVLSLSFLESALALYKDIKSPECAMGALLLAAYLRCGLDQGGFPSVSVASFLAALRQDLSCEGNLSVFVLLDEVNDVDPAKLGPLIKALVNSTFDAASATLVYPVLFGTHSPLKELDVSTSGCRLLPFSSDPLPLLTKSDVEQLLTTLASQSIDPADKEAFILRGDFKRVNAFWQLIDDVHGWPRGLEVVLREVSDRYLKFNEDVTLISINDVASAARQRIAELYLGNSSGEVLALPSGALKYALLGTTVKEEMHIPGTQITVHQFVSLRAQAALVDSKLVIPFLWLSAHASMRKLPALYKVWDTIVATDAEAMGWALFEQLCAVVLSLRLSVLADHHRDLHPAGPAVVSASELLAGVRWAQGKGLPAALAFTRDHEPDPTAVGTVTHQWPLSTKAKATQLALRVRLQTGYQVDLTSTACGVALVNAPSAPYADVFMPLRVQGQDKPVLLLLQCKWTNANKGITATTIWGEYKKCGDAWRRARLAEHFGSWIFVAVTSSPVEEELPTGTLPLECGTSYLGCVSKANFRDFFGPTFASRAAISSRVDLDVNQMCQSDVQLALGVSSPAAAEIVRAREKARIRSASELLALVHEPKARERVASVCSRRVLLFDTVEP